MCEGRARAPLVVACPGCQRAVARCLQAMAGPGGLEPPISRLEGGRSSSELQARSPQAAPCPRVSSPRTARPWLRPARVQPLLPPLRGALRAGRASFLSPGTSPGPRRSSLRPQRAELGSAHWTAIASHSTRVKRAVIRNTCFYRAWTSSRSHAGHTSRDARGPAGAPRGHRSPRRGQVIVRHQGYALFIAWAAMLARCRYTPPIARFQWSAHEGWTPVVRGSPRAHTLFIPAGSRRSQEARARNAEGRLGSFPRRPSRISS
jgi:hypothetical protein